jgi:hypothetical protein
MTFISYFEDTFTRNLHGLEISCRIFMFRGILPKLSYISDRQILGASF